MRLSRTAIRRVVHLAALLSVFAAVGLVVAGPALADDPRGPTVGVTYLSPVKGTLDTSITALTSEPCPSGDYFVVRLYGYGLPKDGANINGAMGIVGLPRTPTNQLYIQLSYVLRDFAADNVKGGAMKGSYDVVVRCRKALDFTSLGDFVGKMTVRGNAFTVVGAAAHPKPYNGPSSAPPSSSAPTQSTVKPVASAGGSSPSPTSGHTAAGPPAASAKSSPVPTNTAVPVAQTQAAGGGGSHHGSRSVLLLLGGVVLIGLALVLLFGDRLRALSRRPAAADTPEDEPADTHQPAK